VTRIRSIAPSFGATLLAAGLLAAPAQAQSSAESSPDLAGPGANVTETVYAPEFYDRYSPRSALDMVQQTPGFTITESAAKRGLGQGGANVLINSQRISSKATSAADTLTRIAADRVVRIEIVDGARLNIPGLSGYVVNVITRGGAMTGRWEWSPELREDRSPRLERGKLFVSGDAAGWNYSASLLADQSGNIAIGNEHATDERAVLYDTRIERDATDNTRLQGSLDLSHEALDGAVANIRLLAYHDDRDQREVSNRFGTRLPDRMRLYERANEIDNFELGGDYEFGFGPGRLNSSACTRPGRPLPSKPSSSIITASAPALARAYRRKAKAANPSCAANTRSAPTAATGRSHSKAPSTISTPAAGSTICQAPTMSS
jgi:hypothetical protein